MSYKKTPQNHPISKLLKFFPPFLTIESIDHISFEFQQNQIGLELDFFLQYPLKANDTQIIFNSGLLFKLNYSIFTMSSQNQKKILQIFNHWMNFDETFCLLIIESGFLLNVTKLMMDHREDTINLLITLSQNSICAKRVSFSLGLCDFFADSQITAETLKNYIELLLLLLEANFEGFEDTFYNSIHMFFKTSPKSISFILFTIIDKTENSLRVHQIFDILQKNDLRELIFNSSNEKDKEKNELAMNIIQFLQTYDRSERLENQDQIFSQIREVFTDLSFSEKSFLIHYMHEFEFYQNETFLDFFQEQKDLIEIPNIDELFHQILQYLVNDHLSDLDNLIKGEAWDNIYTLLLQKNHTVSPTLTSCLLELLIAPFCENKEQFGDLIEFIVADYDGEDIEIPELFCILKKYYADNDDQRIMRMNEFINELEKIYDDFEESN